MACVPYTADMSKVLRIVLAWLLAAALPLQGYAAQAMLFCAPAHHQATVEAPMHEGHSHDHEAMGHADPEDAAAAQAGDDGPAGSGSQAQKCSVCASCCSASAPATALTIVGIQPQPEAVSTAIALAHDRLVVGGLERPPRSLNA